MVIIAVICYALNCQYTLCVFVCRLEYSIIMFAIVFYNSHHVTSSILDMTELGVLGKPRGVYGQDPDISSELYIGVKPIAKRNSTNPFLFRIIYYRLCKLLEEDRLIFYRV